MKLYNAASPNGFRVNVFMKEKGIDVPVVEVGIMDGETRRKEHLERNSLGEIPVLELDDGTMITESVAICRYLEELHPVPTLFGMSSIERAKVEMWNRRIEQQLMAVIGNVGLHEFEFFADKIEQIPEFAASQRSLFMKNINWLDQEMSDGRPFISGDKFSVADITGIATLVICQFANEEIPENFVHVKKWESSMRNRESWPM